MRRQCASWARSRCGVCVEAHSSSVLVSSAQRAITPRVSIGAPLTRLMRNVPSTVHGRLGQPRVRLARAHGRFDDDVARHGGVELRAPPGRSASSTVDDVRQRLVVDVDQLERVLGHVPVDGRHRHHGLALVARDVVRHAVERRWAPSRETGAGP